MVRFAFTKVGMTTSFLPTGEAQGVTLLQMMPTRVLRHERTECGRDVVVVEYDTLHRKKLVRGWVVTDPTLYPVGAEISAPAYAAGQKIQVTGICKGRGFQDVMTRWGMGGGPASHGSRFHRGGGSIGMRTEPGRVPKGKKMPGQFGNTQVTLRGVKVCEWFQEKAVLAIVGGVPGSRGGVLFI
jgi:large subunit ribosomal protein L3